MKYIVPEYYEHFKCKCGECRHSCCDGWPIRISMKEYYQLLGIICSDKLRAKLDCALKISLEPCNEYFAQISTDWHGLCSLHREDGLCALQVELGEDSLPEVCRFYPRHTVKLTESYKCSCSNSCEKIVELLLDLKEPLRFEVKDLSLVPEFDINLSSNRIEDCKKTISILQDRGLPLPERFILLGNFLYATDIFSRKPDNLSIAFQIQYLFIKYFEYSSSISDYCKASQTYFGIEIEYKEKLSAEDLNAITEKYISASKHLEAILPDWQILFEQLIVNHMFYNNFPYTGNQEVMTDAFLSLASMYSFLRFNILGYMSDKTSLENLVDFLSAMFRLIEHSDFKSTVVNLYKKEKYLQKYIPQLLYL